MNTKIIKLGWCLLFILFHQVVLAQNNAIFSGGSNDGWNKASFEQSGNSIFKGGTSDGWNSQLYSSATTNIFSGGTSDGWNVGNYNSQYDEIRKGGTSDGWNVGNYNSPYDDVRKGGIGDGWASTYQPSGPLPVVFISFIANKTNFDTDALLQWNVASELNADRYEVERSLDAVSFTKIGEVKATGNSQTEIKYNFTDENPAQGQNYYRLKQLDKDGKYIYTPVRVLNFSDNAELVNIYPNPSSGKVTVSLTSAYMNSNAALNVINMNGAVVYHVKLVDYKLPTLEMDLNNLASGTYMIHLNSGTHNYGVKLVIVK
jgi:hypothetical protein